MKRFLFYGIHNETQRPWDWIFKLVKNSEHWTWGFIYVVVIMNVRIHILCAASEQMSDQRFAEMSEVGGLYAYASVNTRHPDINMYFTKYPLNARAMENHSSTSNSFQLCSWDAVINSTSSGWAGTFFSVPLPDTYDTYNYLPLRRDLGWPHGWIYFVAYSSFIFWYFVHHTLLGLGSNVGAFLVK